MEASPKFQSSINNTVAVKVALNEDLRRFTFNGDYSGLCQEIGSTFQLGARASFTLKYKDNEEDLITLCNDRDLAEAKRVCDSTLKLTVLLSTAAPSTGITEIVEAPKPDKEAKEAKAAEREQRQKEKEQKRALKEAKDKKKDKKKEDKPVSEGKVPEKPAKGKEPEKKPSKELSKEERQKQKDQKRALKGAKKEHKQEEKEQKKALKEAKKSEPKDDAVKPPKAKFEARFVKDITLEDGTEVQPGASLVKTWRFRNEGTKSWPSGSKLLFVSKLKGDIMGAPEEVLAPVAEPGAEVDVSVPLVAPTAPGRYVGFWRLCTPEGKKFGQRVRVLVYVPAASSSDSSTAEEETPKKKKEAGTPCKHKKERKETAAATTEVTSSELLEKVAQLEGLGFTNKKRNLKLLQKFGGDLSAVLNRLVLRQQKEKKLRQSPKKKNDDM